MDINLNLIAYMGIWRCVPCLGDLTLGLELEGPSCGLDDVLFVDDDNISTAVGVLGGDIVIREFRILRLDNDFMGTTSCSRMGRKNRLQLTVGRSVTGRGGGGHFGYEENRYINNEEEGKLMCC